MCVWVFYWVVGEFFCLFLLLGWLLTVVVLGKFFCGVVCFFEECILEDCRPNILNKHTLLRSLKTADFKQIAI